MYVFLTEFLYEGKLYAGPYIIAENFKEAEEKADEYKVVIVGQLVDIIEDFDELEEYVPTIH